jgi:hypothetical protein
VLAFYLIGVMLEYTADYGLYRFEEGSFNFFFSGWEGIYLRSRVRSSSSYI